MTIRDLFIDVRLSIPLKYKEKTLFGDITLYYFPTPSVNEDWADGMMDLINITGKTKELILKLSERRSFPRWSLNRFDNIN